jgi:signal transduction histidine kinase
MNSTSPSRLRARPRTTLLVAILLLTATLAGVLTYEAWAAERSQRDTAEGALRDYAAFAAWVFGVTAKGKIYEAVISIFGPIEHDMTLPPGAPPPSPAMLARAGVAVYQCDKSKAYFARLDLPSKHLVIHGHAPDSAVQRWIRDAVAVDVSDKYHRDWGYSTVSTMVDGAPYTLAYQVKWRSDGSPAAAYGFRMCLKSFARPAFRETLAGERLLPETLTGDVANDSLFQVIVSDGSGHEVWRSAKSFPRTYSADSKMPYYGGLVTTVAVNPRMAHKLLIGGFPQSRLPILFGVLALTLALAAIGVLQLRREDELARLRSGFIANVSHELRTPLAQLRMFAETLLLGRVRSEGERQRSLEILDQEARRLSHLVENVLQFSRAERQAIKLSPKDGPLAPQVREALEVFSPMARARQVRVTAELDESVHATVDAGALRQIVLNLLDNAVKYGPAGQEVRVHLARAGRFARVAVEDEGPGIPERDRRRIWEPFYRLERPEHSATAGSGIGLSIVRELALGHGGRAWVERARDGEGNGGACFVVEIPCSDPPQSTVRNSGEREEPAAAGRGSGGGAQAEERPT